ncbi:MAG TPA: hypothetical protein VHC00_06700 [Rhizobiaceae bacterium]|nr:hypothetical protein [Rhizobiaceae bacterium]
MRTVAAILRELFGLFVDDGALAILALLVVAIAALLAVGLHADNRITGAVLVAGSVASLLFSVFKAIRKNGS